MGNVTSVQATRNLLENLEILGMISIGMRLPEHSKITSQQSAVIESLRLFFRPSGHWKGMGALLYTGTLGICLAVVVSGLFFSVELPQASTSKRSQDDQTVFCLRADPGWDGPE